MITYFQLDLGLYLGCFKPRSSPDPANNQLIMGQHQGPHQCCFEHQCGPRVSRQWTECWAPGFLLEFRDSPGAWTQASPVLASRARLGSDLQSPNLTSYPTCVAWQETWLFRSGIRFHHVFKLISVSSPSYSSCLGCPTGCSDAKDLQG